jgi:hypothetical protein
LLFVVWCFRLVLDGGNFEWMTPMEAFAMQFPIMHILKITAVEIDVDVNLVFKNLFWRWKGQRWHLQNQVHW